MKMIETLEFWMGIAAGMMIGAYISWVAFKLAHSSILKQLDRRINQEVSMIGQKPGTELENRKDVIGDISPFATALMEFINSKVEHQTKLVSWVNNFADQTYEGVVLIKQTKVRFAVSKERAEEPEEWQQYVMKRLKKFQLLPG